MGAPLTHGWEYAKEQQKFLRSIVEKGNRWKYPKHVVSWIEEQIKLIKAGKAARIKSPPGYDVGHRTAAILKGKHAIDNFKLELATMNRARGPKERSIARRGWKMVRIWLERLKKGKKRIKVVPLPK